MKQLAIKGHSTRKKEIIELLEMFGGINKHQLTATRETYVYFVDEDGIIRLLKIQQLIPEQFIIFTLEEFEQKFPYKVGDKVMTNDGDKANIVGMVWDNDIDDIFYEIQICNEVIKYPKELLQHYKEETIGKEIIYDEIDFNRCPCADKVQLILGNDFEIKVEDGKTFVVRKKNQYPKTYAECCRVVNANPYIMLTYDLSNGQKYFYDADNIELHNNFRRLKICRDAYWKIAGDQMGLGKPWEPDWGSCVDKFCITIFKNKQTFDDSQYISRILAFPTEEMRDAFYENFKELIEQCKELL